MIAVLQSPGSSSCITASTNEANGRGAERKGFQRERRKGMKREEEDHLSLSSLLAAMVKKSLVGCRTEEDDDLSSMEIGWPTNVQHVAHVTFDRFHGFLGLPVEFEPEIPPRPPSASASVFGVSTESMQCSYDKRGNSVPTILLLMQKRLYDQGGLQAVGIFRINAENSQEELVRDQLNRGIVPDGIDVHCLAGLIKAWFRELPRGVLDSLAPEQVMQCQTEDECTQLVKQLPPVEGALFNWAINLMADVVVAELQNKMNARNIAVVFAPNMTQMDDPLSALVYAVQVMNILKTLILMTLKQRQEEPVSGASFSSFHDPSNEEGCRHCFLLLDPASNKDTKSSSEKLTLEDHGESQVKLVESSSSSSRGESTGRRSRASPKTAKQPKEMKKKSRGISLVSRINSRMERVEAWR